MKSDRPIKDFLAEAEDILDAGSQSLNAIDAAHEAGRTDPDQLNALFRALHSFKGLSGMFGLKEPQELSHKMEYMLDEMRLGKLQISRDVLDTLAEILVQLSRMVQQAGLKQPFEDITESVRRIEGILNAKDSAGAEKSLVEQIEIDQAVLQVLTEYEEHRLRESVRERKNLFLVKAEFDFTEFEAGLKAIVDKAKKNGEAICTLPTAAATAGIGFSILIGTTDDEQTVTAEISGPNIKIEKVAYKTPPRSEPSKTVAPVAPSALKSASNTVRVDIGKLDGLMNVVGEMHLIKNFVSRIVKDLRAMQGFTGLAIDLHKAHRSLERRLNELQEGIIDVRMVPIGQIFTRLAQVVRKYAKEVGKEINLELHGEETELDKLMIEDLADPLMHLIRNAIDHGIEPPDVRQKNGKPAQGTVRLTAFPKGNHVVITIEDDGAGMDGKRIIAKAVEKGLLTEEHGLDLVRDRREVFDLIFQPGFTTKEKVTEISGRGVGMDVVKRNVSKLSGMIDIQTELGAGSRFTLTLPITLAIIKALIVEAGDQTFAIPLGSVLEILQTETSKVETVEGREVMAVREDTIPLLRVTSAFGLPERDASQSFHVVLVGLAERRLGIIVDTLRDQQEIVIKPLGKRLADVPGIAGATELGDRRGVVLVLDIESLVEKFLKKATGSRNR